MRGWGKGPGLSLEGSNGAGGGVRAIGQLSRPVDDREENGNVMAGWGSEMIL